MLTYISRKHAAFIASVAVMCLLPTLTYAGWGWAQKAGGGDWNDVITGTVPADGQNDALSWDWTKTDATKKICVAITTRDKDKSGSYTAGQGSITLQDKWLWTGPPALPTSATFELTVTSSTSSSVTCRKIKAGDGSAGTTRVTAHTTASKPPFPNSTGEGDKWGARSWKSVDLLTQAAEPDADKRRKINLSGQFTIDAEGKLPPIWSGGVNFNFNIGTEVLNQAAEGQEGSDSTGAEGTETVADCESPSTICSASVTLTVNPTAAGIDGGAWGDAHETTVSGSVQVNTLDLLVN